MVYFGSHVYFTPNKAHSITPLCMHKAKERRSSGDGAGGSRARFSLRGPVQAAERLFRDYVDGSRQKHAANRLREGT